MRGEGDDYPETRAAPPVWPSPSRLEGSPELQQGQGMLPGGWMLAGCLADGLTDPVSEAAAPHGSEARRSGG